MAQATTRVDFAWTNKVSWTIAVTAQNHDTTPATDIDFTDASIDVRIKDQNGCLKLHATVGDGVSLDDPLAPEISFTADQMKTLCAGQYNIGAVFENADGDGQLFVGTLTIIDGVAEI